MLLEFTEAIVPPRILYGFVENCKAFNELFYIMEH